MSTERDIPRFPEELFHSLRESVTRLYCPKIIVVCFIRKVPKSNEKKLSKDPGF